MFKPPEDITFNFPPPYEDSKLTEDVVFNNERRLNAIEKSDKAYMSKIKADVLGHKIREVIKQKVQANKNQKISELELIKERIRTLFFTADEDYSGTITREEFKNMLPKIFSASDLLTITENDAKLAFELIDADNSNTIAYAEFMNYILYDEDEMKLILYKIRLEVKFFLSKRDDYPFFEEYRRLSMAVKPSVMSYSRFDSEMVRFLGFSSLTKDQLVFLYKILKGNKTDLLLVEFQNFLGLQCSDLFGDIKRCVTSFGFATSGNNESKYREMKFIPYKLQDRLTAFKMGGFLSKNGSFWYCLKNSDSYICRNEFLKERIVDIKVTTKKVDKQLIVENFVALKDIFNNYVKTYSGKFLYVKRDPTCDTPIIDLKLQTSDDDIMRYREKGFVCIDDPICKFNNYPVYLWVLHCETITSLPKVLETEIGTRNVVTGSLTKSILKVIRDYLIDKQLTFDVFIKEYSKDNKMDQSMFTKLCEKLMLKYKNKELKIAFDYLDESKDKKIDVKEFKTALSLKPKEIEQSLAYFADQLADDSLKYIQFKTLIGMKKGHIEIIEFHRILTDSNCRLLLDELKEWCTKEKMLEGSIVDYYKFFQIWWEDNLNTDTAGLPNPNKVSKHSDGTDYVKLKGDEGVSTAYSKIQTEYRKKALDLGHNEYFNVESLFVNLGASGSHDKIEVKTLYSLFSNKPFYFMFEKSDDYAKLLCKITQTPTPQGLTIQGLTHFLLDGIDKLIQKLKDAVNEASKRGTNTYDFFKQMDRNHDGVIDKSEIKAGMANVTNQKIILNDEELALLFTRFDLDHSGKISLDEFINLIHEEQLLRKLTNQQRANIKLTENDLYNEGSLTVIINEASGVQLSSVGDCRPYVTVKLLPLDGKLYRGSTRSSNDVNCLNTTYKVIWTNHEENEVLLKFPGLYYGNSLSLVFDLYDTAPHSDINIGTATMNISDIKKYILSSETFFIQLENRRHLEVGLLSGTLNLLPIDLEAEGVEYNSSIPKELPKIDTAGTIYITIHEAKQYNYDSGKVKVMLLPTKETDETKEVKQQIPGTVMKWIKSDKKVLKLKYQGNQNDIGIDFIMIRDKLIQSEQLGHKVLSKKLLEKALIASPIPVRIEDNKGDTVAMLQVSIQFIPDDDDLNEDEESKVEYIKDEELSKSIGYARLKEIIKQAIPASKTPEIKQKFKKLDKSGKGEIKFKDFCSILKDYKVEVNDEIKATCITEFDPDRKGMINYKLFQILLPSETNDEIIERLKKSIIIAETQGKEFRKAFEALDTNHKGYIDKNTFRQAIRTLVDPTPNDDDIEILFSKFDLDRNGQISYEEFFAFLSTDQRVDDNAVVTQIIAKLKTLIREDNIDSVRRLFDRFDKNGGGTQSKAEFIRALKELGITTLKESEEVAVIKHFDANNDGTIDYEEFLAKLLPNYKSLEDSTLIDEIIKRLSDWVKRYPNVISQFRETLEKLSKTYHLYLDKETGKKEGKGDVTKREFRSALEAVGQKLNDREWECIMKWFSLPNGGGGIDVEQFIRRISDGIQLVEDSLTSESKFNDNDLRGSKGNKEIREIEIIVKDRIKELGRYYDIYEELKRISVNDRLNVRDLYNYLNREGYNLSPKQLNILMNAIDPNELGYCSLPYFLDTLHIPSPESFKSNNYNDNYYNQSPYSQTLPMYGQQQQQPQYFGGMGYQTMPMRGVGGFPHLTYNPVVPVGAFTDYEKKKEEFDRTGMFTCPFCNFLNKRKQYCEICSYQNPYIDWSEVHMCPRCHRPNAGNQRRCYACESDLLMSGSSKQFSYIPNPRKGGESKSSDPPPPPMRSSTVREGKE